MSQHHHWLRLIWPSLQASWQGSDWTALLCQDELGTKLSLPVRDYFVHLPWRCSRSNTAWAALRLSEVAWPTQCLSQNVSVPVRLKMSPPWALTLLKSSTVWTLQTARRLAFLGPPRLTAVELIQYQAEHLGIEFQMFPILAYSRCPTLPSRARWRHYQKASLA